MESASPATTAPKVEAVYAGLEAQLGATAIAQLYAALDAVLDALDAAPASSGDAHAPLTRPRS